MANRIAGALAGAGVAPGEQVAMLLRNCREMAAVILGCQKAGFVACPMNTWARTTELKATLAHTSAKVVFYDTKHSEQLESALTDDIGLIAIGDPLDALDGSIPFDEFLERGTARPPSPPHPAPWVGEDRDPHLGYDGDS